MVIAFNETSKRMLDRTPPFNTQDSDWRKLVIQSEIQLAWSWHGLRSRKGASISVLHNPQKSIHLPKHDQERERERGSKGHYSWFIQRVPFWMLQLLVKGWTQGSFWDRLNGVNERLVNHAVHALLLSPEKYPRLTLRWQFWGFKRQKPRVQMLRHASYMLSTPRSR